MSGCHSRDHGSTLPDGFGGWGSWVGMAEPSPVNHQAVFATCVPTQMPLPEIHLDFPNANGFEKGALLAPLQEAANGGGQVSRRSLARTPAYERSEGRCRGEPQKKPGGGEMPKGKYPRSRRGGSKLGGLNGGGFLRGSSCRCLRTRFQSQWESWCLGRGAPGPQASLGMEGGRRAVLGVPEMEGERGSRPRSITNGGWGRLPCSPTPSTEQREPPAFRAPTLRSPNLSSVVGARPSPRHSHWERTRAQCSRRLRLLFHPPWGAPSGSLQAQGFRQATPHVRGLPTARSRAGTRSLFPVLGARASVA